MKKPITEFEEPLGRKMVQFTERKIAEVNQRLEAFELRVLARPASPVDVSTIQAAVDSLLLPTFHHLPLERVPRGVGVEQRTRREHERRSAER